MPKKAVAIFFLAALVGAVVFVYLTFPRTKDEIPQSNNQRPFPSAPVPGGVPLPEPAPAPNTPKLPPGPKLHVMAWASPQEAQELETRAQAFTAASGRQVSLSIQSSPSNYRQALQDAMSSSTPPDVCLISSRDFCGIDPAVDLAQVNPLPGSAQRSIAAFTVNGRIKAVPAEYSVDVLYYNPLYFDQAGLGYPGPQWKWDMLESIARALTSLQLKNAAGQPVYPIELTPTFGLWNILCAEVGRPALDLNTWHIADDGAKDAQMRGLYLIHHLFQELSITAPLPPTNASPGYYFGQQRAALFIGPSDLTASLPKFAYRYTVLPSDIIRASQAQVDGWAVAARSDEADAAQELATYLAQVPLHHGWSSVLKPSNTDASATLCYDALNLSVIPRIDIKSAPLAQFLDQQILLLSQNFQVKSNDTYARIQKEYRGETSSPEIETGLPKALGAPTGTQSTSTAPL